MSVVESQQMDALHRANDVRSQTTAVKRWLGELTQKEAIREVVRLLLEDPDTVGAVKIHTLLTAIPRLGDKKVQQLLVNRAEGSYVWPFRRVDELTDRQRRRIADGLLGRRT